MGSVQGSFVTCAWIIMPSRWHSKQGKFCLVTSHSLWVSPRRFTNRYPALSIFS